MDIQQLIEQKRQQLAKLKAQLEVLEELAAESGVSSRRRGRPRRPGHTPAVVTSARKGRRGRRAGRGANQQKVLGVLTGTPMRAKDIAATARLSAASANQVLMGLKKTGMVEQTGRGLYRRADGASTAASESRTPRAARSPRTKASRKPRRSLQPVRGEDTVHPEEVSQEGKAQPASPA